MKTLIISDIHSNIHALEAIWSQEKDSDLIYCAGDLVDYGPYPKEVLAWVSSHPIHCVQGNHDRFLALVYRRGDLHKFIPTDQRYWVHHNASRLDEDQITFLENLPVARTFEADGYTYGLTHLYNDYEEIVSLHAFEQFRSQIYPQPEGQHLERMIFGHTHRQSIRYLSNTRFWFNPGSVSYRRKDDPDRNAHYATIIDGQISLHQLTYDIRPVFQAMLPARIRESEMDHTHICFS